MVSPEPKAILEFLSPLPLDTEAAQVQFLRHIKEETNGEIASEMDLGLNSREAGSRRIVHERNVP